MFRNKISLILLKLISVVNVKRNPPALAAQDWAEQIWISGI